MGDQTKTRKKTGDMVCKAGIYIAFEWAGGNGIGILLGDLTASRQKDEMIDITGRYSLVMGHE